MVRIRNNLDEPVRTCERFNLSTFLALKSPVTKRKIRFSLITFDRRMRKQKQETKLLL